METNEFKKREKITREELGNDEKKGGDRTKKM